MYRCPPDSRSFARLLVLSGALVGVSAWAAPPRQSEAKADVAAGIAADEQALHAARLGTDGPALLDFFRQRTVTDDRLTRMQALVRKLGDESFDVRQKASAELTALGPVVLPLLHLAMKDPDVEIRRRAEDCSEIIEQGHNANLAPAAVRLLAVRKPAGAVEVLLAYLPFADNETLVEEVRTTLEALAVRDGKPDPALVAALNDKLPARRAAAAAALARAGVTDQRDGIRKLLQDPDATVRMHAGLALVGVGDKDAMPVLIGLLAELPETQLWPIEDTLYRLAGDQAPTLAAGSDDAGRHKYRDAWSAWWKKNGAAMDLAKTSVASPLHGYTMLVLLDLGRILEVDHTGTVRWQLDKLQFPLDAQLLPNDHVLVAENAANRITERDLKGNVVWEQKVEAPLMGQRLPNGHTFIGTRTQLLEVDASGKEVFSHTRPNGDLFMRAVKLRNGDIACVTSGYRFLRLDSVTGKELQNIGVDIHTYGGRIEVLPNGRVLVPQYSANKVVEQDAQGKVVWEIEFEQPIAAVRLPNGHTLVTSMNQQRAVEFDRRGKQMWEYKAETRVTRAWRR